MSTGDREFRHGYPGRADFPENQPEIKTVDVTPDGMLLAAFNIAEFLLNTYDIGEIGDPNTTELGIVLFKVMVENRALIKKSSWLRENPE